MPNPIDSYMLLVHKRWTMLKLIKRFGRRKIEESLMLFPPSLTIYLPSVCLTFALCLVLCCAGTVSVCSFDKLVKTKQRTTDKLINVRKWGEDWKIKYTVQKQKTGEKMEETIRTLEHEIKGKDKEIKQWEKECTLLLARCSSLEENLKKRAEEIKEHVELRLQVFLFYSPSLLFSSYLFFSFQGKSTSRRKKQ